MIARHHNIYIVKAPSLILTQQVYSVLLLLLFYNFNYLVSTTQTAKPRHGFITMLIIKSIFILTAFLEINRMDNGNDLCKPKTLLHNGSFRSHHIYKRHDQQTCYILVMTSSCFPLKKKKHACIQFVPLIFDFKGSRRKKG